MVSQEKEAHPSAAQFIMHDFYLDDGLTGVESAQQAKDLIQGACEICEKGGLHLHKFVSNDCQVLKLVPQSERAVDVILNLPSEQLLIERVLGVQWSVGLDWKCDLLCLNELQIPRCFEPKTLNGKKTYELHSFTDASMSGYRQCSYLRVKDKGENVHVSLVMGKSSVTPMKITTIPRLELTAAVVSAKVVVMVQEELNYANLKQYFWTDSKVVLGYINNNAKRFHMFVANRVQVIKSNTDTKELRYMDTKKNPADHASRGLNAEELMKSKWFSGPAFLWEKEILSSKKEIPNIQIGDPEVKATVAQLLLRNPSASLIAY